MSKNTEKLDKQHRYPWEVIETAVQLHVAENLTYRAIADKMQGFGVDVSHKTIFEWVQKFADNVNTRARKRVARYSVEESYVKCNGEWMYMYQAVDGKKAAVGVFLRPRRSLALAKKFFKKTLEN
jgi:transposase-like protein